MARTLTIDKVEGARVNLSIDPITGDMALMVSYSLKAGSATIQSKTVDATSKLTAAQRTAIANVALRILEAVKTDEGV